jgi:hypothetical protein
MDGRADHLATGLSVHLDSPHTESVASDIAGRGPAPRQTRASSRDQQPVDATTGPRRIRPLCRSLVRRSS